MDGIWDGFVTAVAWGLYPVGFTLDWLNAMGEVYWIHTGNEA